MSEVTAPAATEAPEKPVNGIAGSGKDANADGREFLTFKLGDEEYGVDILKVQEIRSYDTVTRLPAAPDYIKGVINLRGTIVPIVDMRLRFKMEQAAYNEFTVMIMLSVGERIIGLIVDGVSDVISLADDQIRPPPDMSAGALDTRFVTGLGSVDERLLILVDIEALMGSEGLALADDLATDDAETMH